MSAYRDTGVRDGRTSRLVTIPNALSLLRLASVPVFVWLFATGRENAAVVLYGVGAWTDFFDGYIARRMGSVTEAGKLLDPLADRAFIVALALALLIRGTVAWWLAAVIIARDAAVLLAWPVLERRGLPRLAVSFQGKLATALLLFGLTWLLLSETTFPLATVGDEVGIAFTVIGAAIYWLAALGYLREASRRLRAMAEGKVDAQ